MNTESIIVDSKTQIEYIYKKIALEYAGRELMILKKVKGNGFPHLIDYEISEGMVEMKLKYIEGRRLSDCEFQIIEWMDLFKRCVQKLDSLHRQKIYHRDISPSNILVDVCIEPFIIDFGSAILLDELTNESAIVGTVEYSAPEAIFNPKTYGETSDYYALAKVFLEKLEPLSAQLPSSFLNCLAKCIEINPQNRFRNASEILHDLYSAL